MSDTPLPSPRAAEHDDYQWLTSTAGNDALRRAAALRGELTARLARLRSELSPRRAALVFELLDLRRRGREKFGRADELFFTAKGLEQATDEHVARWKAARFADCRRTADLCTGIGGDLLALAAVCDTVGVDRDPLCALYATANVQATAPQHSAQVLCQDVLDVNLAEFDAWHIDPDRRPQGKRTTRVELYEPSDEAIELLLRQNTNAAIKLAPAAILPAAWQERAELEWISRGRQCRQLVAWFGTLAKFPGQRRATVLTNREEDAASIIGGSDVEVPVAARIGRYVFEPDAAVLAAKLTATAANAFRLAAVAPGVAYLTADEPVDGDHLLATFEVEEVLPLDLKKVKQALNARDVGALEIKVRGVEEDPARLRNKLRLRGARAMTLLITRIERGVIAILARRV